MAEIHEILEKEGFECLNRASGGFAAVHKVRNKKYNHVRAIKVILGDIESENDNKYRTFLSECKKLFRLSCSGHPNIVRIYRHMLIDSRAMVEMDYIKGDSLIGYLEKNNNFVPVDEVLKMLSDISSALALCHVDIYKYCYDRERDKLKDDPNDARQVLIDDETRQRLIKTYRIVHNDMHDRNVMRREDGTYILLDFGLAVTADEADRSSRIENGVDFFKAPEKWKGKPITASVDIYGLGVMLYEYLAGQLPFIFDGDRSNFEDRCAYMNKHCTENPKEIFPLRKHVYEKAHPGKTMDKPDYPQWLEDLIMKCLAKNPSDRYADGKELHDEVKGHLNCLWSEYHEILQRYNSLEKEFENYKIKDKCLDNARERDTTLKIKRLEKDLKVEKEESQRKDAQLREALETIKLLTRQLQELNKDDDDVIELDVVNILGKINKK